MRRHNTAKGTERVRRRNIAATLMCLACATVSLAGGQRGIAQDIEARSITTSRTYGRHSTFNPNGFVFSPDGKILAMRDHWEMKLWDLDKDKEWKATSGILVSRSSPLLMDKKPDFLIGKGADLLWEGSQNGEEVDRRRIEGMAFSPDGKSLALSCTFGVLFFDIATGKENRPAIWSWGPGKIAFEAKALTFSPDGETLATWNGSESILWDLKKHKMRVKTPTWNEYGVCCLSFSPDSKTVATLTYDERTAVGQPTIGLWAADTGKRRDLSKDDDKGYVTAILMPDGETLVAGTRRGSLYLWDLKIGKVKAAVADPACRQDILALAYSPDGRTLAAMHKQHEISLWEVVTLKKRAILHAPGNNWPPLAFSPDGRWLASRCDAPSNHSTIQLWNLATVKGDPPDAAGMRRLWNALGNDDAELAYRAIRTLATFPRQTLPLLRKRLQPTSLSDVQRRKIEQWLADLDDDEFATRQKASNELEKCGVLAEATLRRALTGRLSLEVRRRISTILESIERQKAMEPLQQSRALEVLEHIGTAEARGLLEDLAKGVPEARLTREAKASLTRLAKRPVRKP